MTNWLSKQPFLIGLLASITAGILYYVSFKGLKIGINTSISEMAIGYAIAFQLVELIGLSLQFSGKLKSNNKTDNNIFKVIEYALYVVLVVDFLMVFLGYQGFNNLGPTAFNQVVIVAGRLVISLLAAVFPELLTLFALHLFSEASKPIVTDISQPGKHNFGLETNLANTRHPETVRQVG